MDLAELNRLLDAGRVRADELEDKLAALLKPILDRAADQAARKFSATATDFLTASIFPMSGTFAAPSPGSTMIAVKPRPDEAAALAEDGGEPAETLHVTLALLGDTAEEDIPAVVEALKPVAAAHGPLSGEVGGVGAFDDNGNGHPAILLPDVPGLVELRQAVCLALLKAGLDYSRGHGFAPHVTIRYGDGDPPSEDSVGLPLHFDELVVARGDVPYPLPLVGAPAVTAAGGKKSGPPKWGAPAPDELIDVAALAAAITDKTRPVRLAFLERVMRSTLERAGIDWDITNPFVARALASTASQIPNIAETTRSNLMRIIAKAYEDGLSIPDTASLIRAGMKDATPARAVTIARTELAGAVNSGSLAAVQIVDSAAGGEGHYKVWLTAPGAPHPRHEDYEGLDRQTVPLDAYFQVGDSELQYPADPNGDPGETINCRCLAPWTRLSGVLTAASMRPFEGKLVRLSTAGGHDLSVTENHPILTRRGWLPAGQVENGDDLICRRGFNLSASGPDVEDIPASAKERFASLQLAAFRTQRIPLGGVNFHGEIPVGEVDVVVPDWVLPGDDDPALAQHLHQLALALTHREMGLDSNGATLGRIKEAQTVRVSGTSKFSNASVAENPADRISVNAVALAEREDTLSRSVASRDLWPHRSRSIQETLMIPFGLGSPDSSSTEVLPDRHRSDSDLASDLLVTHPTLVEADPVVNIEPISFAGHVFNFSSHTGTLCTEGIITANCALAYSESLNIE